MIKASEDEFDTSVIADALGFIHRTGKPLPTRPLVLPERGMKTRIASIFPGLATVFSQRINKAMQAPLRKIPAFHYDSGPGDTDVESALSGRQAHDTEIMSGDLTAASDYIEFDASRAIWTAFCDQAQEDDVDGWTDAVRECGLILLGEHRLELDEGGIEKKLGPKPWAGSRRRSALARRRGELRWA
jgi:hypothetical protein